MLKKKNLWRGLTMVFALLLAVSMMAGNILELYRTSVDAFLGTRSTQTVTEQSDDESDAWTYKSEFTTAKEAYEGFKAFAIETSQETFALLKNENGALPLAKDAKITMLGVRSYAPVYGNSGGSVPDGKSTVQIFDAFTERGFQLNPETLAAYEAFFADKEWTKPQFGGGILPAYAEITAYDDPHELTLDELKQLNPDFESKYNCTIVVDPTSGNGDRLNKLMAEQNDPTADVALLTKSFAQTGNEAGLFEKIDTNIVTSIGDLYDIAVNADGYGPCYSLCRYGIMYNADALEKAGLPAPTSYEGLFDDQYAHMVALPDMTSTAGPYMLVAMAEAMGGSQEDVTPAMELMQEKKDNIDLWYSTSSDVVNAFTTGEANIAVFMDINMPSLTDSGLNMVWVDAAEGSFSAPATANVVKNCKNPELAQLFVEYLISKDTQDKIAEVMNEAPVNKNATMDDSLKTYLAFGDESMNALKEFDEAYITANKEAWIDTFQRTVAVQ